MKISIDLQAFQTEASHNRGVGRYSLSLAQAIAQQGHGHDIRLVANGMYKKEYQELLQQMAGNGSCKIASYQYMPIEGSFGKNDDYQRLVAEAMVRHCYALISPDILHISSIFEGFSGQAVVPTRISPPGTILSATLYDLIPLIMSEKYLKDERTQKWYYRRLATLKECDLLLAISESSRQDAINHLGMKPEQVINISAAINPVIFRPIQLNTEIVSLIFKKYGLREKFILYTGGYDPRKNLNSLISAYAKIDLAVRAQYQLAIVCALSVDEREQLTTFARNEGLRISDLVLSGFVPEEDLVALYNLCSLFVFPSLYEGFGLPVLEAMSCGAPVIGANNSSIPEIIGRSDALFNASNPDDIAQIISRTLTDENYRVELSRGGLERARRFSWKDTAEKAVRAFEETKLRLSLTPRCTISVAESLPLRRMAYFSPLPNQKTGIADYSAELLPALARYFNIDLFTDEINVEDPYITANFNVFHFHEIATKYDEYDIVIYHVGNSRFHVHMYELIQNYPGVVVLHDFFIGGLVACVGTEKSSPDFLANELLFSHGTNCDFSLETECGVHKTIQDFPCNLRLLHAAKGIIVHSPYSIGLMRQYYPTEIDTPIRHIRHMRKTVSQISYEERMILRRKMGFSEQEIVIAAFGGIAPSKLAHLLVKAFIKLNESRDSRVRLVFVGELFSGVYSDQISKMISDSKLREQIQITGYQERESYEHYLYAADMGVQLRSCSRGETSGAILDCLAFGLPVIINDYATFADYPDVVVCKVSADVGEMELAEAMEKLISSHGKRAEYSSRGRLYIEEKHDPELIAADYAVAIDHFKRRKEAMNRPRLITEVAQIVAPYPISPDELHLISKHIEMNEKQFEEEHMRAKEILDKVAFIEETNHSVFAINNDVALTIQTNEAINHLQISSIKPMERIFVDDATTQWRQQMNENVNTSRVDESSKMAFVKKCLNRLIRFHTRLQIHFNNSVAHFANELIQKLAKFENSTYEKLRECEERIETLENTKDQRNNGELHVRISLLESKLAKIDDMLSRMPRQ